MTRTPSSPIDTEQALAHIEVSEQAGTRKMYLGSKIVQSSMRIEHPFDLDLPYTRAMMAFLLFRPHTERLLMIGLGGGSLAKFMYHRLPKIHVTLVEIDPRVVETARNFFFLPPDDERLQVVVDDGAAYVAAHPGCYDVIMVDGHDGQSLSPTLITPQFYAACREALRPNGMLVANLLTADPDMVSYYKNMANAFSWLALALPSPPGNLIALAFERGHVPPRWDPLRIRAREIEAEYGVEFVSLVERMANPEIAHRKE